MSKQTADPADKVRALHVTAEPEEGEFAEPTPADQPPPEPEAQQPQGIPFNVDELFLIYGASQFENQKLRQEVQRLQGQVLSLQKILNERPRRS